MVTAGIIIGIVIMSAMIYMAVGKKSDKLTRIAAIIALGVMILAVIICIIIIFSDTTVAVDPSTLIVGEPPQTNEEGSNSVVIILLVIFLLAIFLIVAILAMRENKKHQLSVGKDNSKPISNW